MEFHVHTEIYRRRPDVQFLAQYSPDEGKTDDLNVTVTSLGVKWEAGPLYVALAHEIHKDFFGGSLNTDNSIASAIVDFDSADPDAEEELILTTAGARSNR